MGPAAREVHNVRLTRTGNTRPPAISQQRQARRRSRSRDATPHARECPRLGPRTRRLIRSIARVVNPLVLRIAGRRHMPVVGIIHHRGRKTGRPYTTPLGIRPATAGGFVMPLTFGERAGWYRNIVAAGGCIVTWRGVNHTVTSPVIVDRATALPAFPRYEQLALRAIGINQFVWLRPEPVSRESSLTSPPQ
jgi:deazaflavin-dependent oxidoreductase (nitroreductase family)